MGLYALAALQLIVALFATYITTKTGSQLRPAAVLMNSLLVVYTVVFAAGLFVFAWNQ